MDGSGIFRVKSVLFEGECKPDIIVVEDVNTGTEYSVYTVIYSDEVEQYVLMVLDKTEVRLVLQPIPNAGV